MTPNTKFLNELNQQEDMSLMQFEEDEEDVYLNMRINEADQSGKNTGSILVPLTNQLKHKLLAKIAKPLGPIKLKKNKLFEHIVEGNQVAKDIQKDNIERLREKIKYIQVYKNSKNYGVQDKYQEDPRYQYFNSCVHKDKELFLPVLEYVHAKTLCLQSYTLSIGHCKALAKAFEYFDEFCNRVIFDNCGIDDEEMAAILNGILKLKDFKKIIYRQNTFAELSLEKLWKILLRKIPNNLEELRIENCKIERTITSELIDKINHRCYLEKLGLVNANISIAAFKGLCVFIEKSPHLRDLDLSWNHIRPSEFAILLEILSTNN